MARLTDLPSELIKRIIEQTISLNRSEQETIWPIHQYHQHNHHHHQQQQQQQHNHQTNNQNLTSNQNHNHNHQNTTLPTTQNNPTQANLQPISIHSNTPNTFSINDLTIPASEEHSTPSNRCNRSDDGGNDAQIPQVSWPDGLPLEPLVPLSLVNRTFQQCAQETLFRHVALYSPWQASLFLRTLNRSKAGSPFLDLEPVFTSIPVDIKGKRRVQCDVDMAPSPRTYRRLNRLGDHVRSLKFMWMGPASMGKGGGSLICDILQSCPLLENIAISTALLSHCKEPLFHALETRTLIKEFLILKNPVENTRKFLWQADEVLSRLFTKWDFLETVEIIGLSGRSGDSIHPILKSIPAFCCSLKIISLIRPNLSEMELKAFLKNSKSTLNTLQITYPSAKLDRAGLYQILKDCTSSELESLTIQVGKEWHPISLKGSGPNGREGTGEDPNQNPYLIDILFKSSLGSKKIKSLAISGPLASSKLFNYLPDSIVKLAWEDCSDIHPASFAKFLSSWSKPLKSDPPNSNKQHQSFDSNDSSGQSNRNLPNLKCCSVGTDDFNWKRSDRRAVESALRERNACFHSSNCQAFFPHAWFHPPHNEEDEQGNAEEDFDLMTDAGWPTSEMDYNQHEGEEDDQDDDEEDNDDYSGGGDEDGFDEGAGGPNGNRSERSRNNRWGRMPPPPMLLPGLFGLPMAAYTFPWNESNGGAGNDGEATAWLFGAGTAGSSVNPPPHPYNLPPHPNSSSSTTNSQNHHNNTTNTASSMNRPPNHSHDQPSSSTARPSSSSTRPTASSSARPSSSSTSTNTTYGNQDHRGSNPTASSSNSRPKSPGLFGPGFKFGKMFEK